MDRRQKKTRDAIFRAFGSLLEKKRFENITVQEIIDEANIGRSTFYAHFETKDELLRSMCTEIFQHVFTQELPQETDRGCNADIRSLELKLGHILYHLQENQLNLKGLLASESGELFMSFLKDYLRDLFSRYLDQFSLDVPEHYLLHHLTGSFAETVKWWVAQDMTPAPENMAGYYMAVIRNQASTGAVSKCICQWSVDHPSRGSKEHQTVKT